MRLQSEHTPAAIIIGLFALLAGMYSITTPIFEASDEIFHFPVIHHIKTTGTLPVQDPEIETMYEQEGSQPPLYYLLGAGLTSFIDTSDIEEIRRWNPHAKIGIPLQPDNRNMVIHTEAENFPWSGTVLAVHMVRFLSVGLSTASIALVYLLTLEVLPERRWMQLTALSLAAFNPMFLFISGSVNNDNLIVLLATWTVLLCVRIIRHGITRQRAATLSIVFALATITKVSGLTLAPLMGLALLAHGLQTGKWRECFYTGFTLIGVWAVIGLWWYIRNINLYGEITGTEMHVAVAGGREAIGMFQVIGQEWYGFWVAYWAWFGAVNILAAEWTYWLFGAITIGGIAGSAIWFVRKGLHEQRRDLVLPGLLLMQIVIVIAAVIRWTLMTYGSQGRLIFPAIGAISILTAIGLLRWVPERFRPYATGVITAPLLLVAVISPFAYIAPVYAPPPTVEEVPDDAIPVGATWGPLELVAVRTESATTYEDGQMPFTAYWRLNEPTNTDFSINYTAYGRSEEAIGKIDSYPGGGTLPTTQMTPGVIIEDRYLIPIEESIEAPTTAFVITGVGRVEPGQYIFIEADEGPPTGAQAGIVYPQNPADCTQPQPPENTVQATISDFAHMEIVPPELEPGAENPVRIIWENDSPAPTFLTTFVHLVDERGETVAQVDAPPVNGHYPTNLWRVPCRVADTYMLTIPEDLPPGTYQLVAGLYDAENGVRTPLFTSDGTPYQDYAVPITELVIEEAAQ